MKNSLTTVFAVIFAIASFFSGLAWYNNVCVAAQWNPTSGYSTDYNGPISWLDWTSVDFSTISTFIPFFGFVLISIGFVRLLVPSKPFNNSGYYPFFKSYNSVTIALGLIGTVWGLIMIGQFEPGRVQMSDLVLCLRTALYSTLVALGWVFLFALPVSTTMQWWCRKLRPEEDDGLDLISSFKEFGLTASDTGKSLARTTNHVQMFNAELEATRSELSTIAKMLRDFAQRNGTDAILVLKSVCSEIQEFLKGLQKDSHARQQEAKEQRNVFKRIETQFEKDRQLRKELTVRLQQSEVDKKAANMQARRDHIEKIVAQLRTAVEQQDKVVAWSWLRKVRKAVASLG